MPEPAFLSQTREARRVLASTSVLYTDLDGTLLGHGGSLLVNGAGQPSTAAAEAVVAVNAAGLAVRIVSGRNRTQLTEISRLLGWRGFIGELGCVVVPDRGEPPVYYTGDWPADAVEPGDTPYLMIERAGALRVLSELFPGRIEQHDPYHVDREATHVLRGHVDLDRAREALSELALPVDIVDNGIIRPPRTTLVDVAEVHAYHLVPHGATKERAVARDLAERGLTRADAIAIGDSEMDVGMAEETALLVLVGNAFEDERVAAAAARHANVVRTAGARGDGWAEFARAWLRAHR